MKLRSIAAMGILIGSFVVSPCLLAMESQPAEVAVESSVSVATYDIEPSVIKIETDLIKQQETEIIEDEYIEEVFYYVYTTSRVNIRTDASLDSDILLSADVDTELSLVQKDAVSGWDLISIDGCEYYVSNEYTTTEKPEQLAKSIEEQIEDSKISASDLRYMSAIIWAEAGNQCEAGQQAVGIVVMNRVASETYKDTVYDVINEPYQFSPVRNGSFAKALSRYDSGDMPDSVVAAATYALQGNTTVNYNGTTYDLAGYLYFSRYVKNAKLTIQDHMFK